MTINFPAIFDTSNPARLQAQLRSLSTSLQTLATQVAYEGAIFVWDNGCLSVPTNTNESGASEIVFESTSSGNTTVIVTVVGAEGGVNASLNGVALGQMSDPNVSEEIQYEFFAGNLLSGLNSFKIWATNSDAAELRRVEVWRNHVKAAIDSATNLANTTATNFNARNDRNSAAVVNPTIAADGTAIDHTTNESGVADISFEWDWAGNEADIDGFIIHVRNSTSATPYVFGTSPAQETQFEVQANKRAVFLFGVASNRYYTFGVQAFRVVDPDVNAAGILKSAIVQPSLSAENPYQPESNVAFAGDVTGTVNGIAATDVNQWASIGGAGKPEDGADVTSKRIGNALINGSFEAGSEGWALDNATITTSNKHSGTQSLRIVERAGDDPNNLSNFIATAPGKRWKITAWAARSASDVPAGDLVVQVREFDAALVQLGIVTIGISFSPAVAGWRFDEAVYTTANPAAQFFRLDIAASMLSSTGVWFVDDVTAAEMPANADIDALETTNGPAEAGADATAGKPITSLSGVGALATLDDITLASVTDAGAMAALGPDDLVFVGATAPADPNANPLWVDTTQSPDQLKRWTGSVWSVIATLATDITAFPSTGALATLDSIGITDIDPQEVNSFASTTRTTNLSVSGNPGIATTVHSIILPASRNNGGKLFVAATNGFSWTNSSEDREAKFWFRVLRTDTSEIINFSEFVPFTRVRNSNSAKNAAPLSVGFDPAVSGVELEVRMLVSGFNSSDSGTVFSGSTMSLVQTRNDT